MIRWLATIAALACTAASAQTGDWCARVAVHPDRRWVSGMSPCDLAWDDSEVAHRADLVLFGRFEDVPAAEDRAERPYCGGPPTTEVNAAYVSRVRSLRPDWRGPMTFAHLPRFDLVSLSEVYAEGFRSEWLLRTKTKLGAVRAWVAADQSAACKGDCRWEANARGLETGVGRDRVVYYVTLRNAKMRRFSPLAAVGDLRIPAYRQWKVTRAKRAVHAGGYDAVMLGEKFGQYFRPGYWFGGARCTSVSSCGGDTIFSAEPDGYGFAEYIAGWAALANDLKAANVPYIVRLIPNPWLRTVAERDTIREVLKGARLVLLNAANTYPRTIEDWTAELRGDGVRVMPIDGRCGWAFP